MAKMLPVRYLVIMYMGYYEVSTVKEFLNTCQLLFNYDIPRINNIKLSTTHTHQLPSFAFILLLYYLLPSHAHPSNHPKPSPISSYDHQLPPYHYHYLSYSLPVVSSLSKPINTNNYLSSCMHVINL